MLVLMVASAVVCTSDDAFPLSTCMMKPSPQSNIAVKKRIFNYRLSRMRCISENGCGLLPNRWRVFRSPFMLEPEKVKTVTLVTITLHNWLRKESENWKIYIPKGLIDHENIEAGEIFEGSWRADDVQGSWYPMSLSPSGNHSTKHPRELREEYSEYFMNEGCVPWQWKSASADF